MDKVYTVVSGETNTDQTFYRTAQQKHIPQCLVSWDNSGSILAITVNNFSTSYDTQFYFFTPKSKNGHCLHYGQKSFDELLENRASRNANDILSYCVQDICWNNNGLFVYLVDNRGNLSMISRCGEFVWLVKDREKTKLFISSNSAHEMKQLQQATYKIRHHPLEPLLCVTDGFSVFDFYRQQHNIDLSLIIQTFGRLNHTSNFTGLHIVHNSVHGYEAVLHIW